MKRKTTLPDVASMAADLQARARQLRDQANALDVGAAALVSAFQPPKELPAPRRTQLTRRKGAPRKPKAPRRPKAKPAPSRKLRAPHAAAEPRNLVGRAPFAKGVFSQTCETDPQRHELVASLQRQGLTRADGRLERGTYDVILKDGVAIVYWRLAAEN